MTASAAVFAAARARRAPRHAVTSAAPAVSAAVTAVIREVAAVSAAAAGAAAATLGMARKREVVRMVHLFMTALRAGTGRAGAALPRWPGSRSRARRGAS